MLFKLLLSLSLATTLTSAFAIPSASTTKQAWLHVFHTEKCAGIPTYMPVAANTCYAFPPGIKSLRVIGHDKDVKYNALHVYSAENCESGPVLQPVLTDACSEVGVYKGIKLEVD